MIGRTGLLTLVFCTCVFGEEKTPRTEGSSILDDQSPGWVGRAALRLLNAGPDELAQAWQAIRDDWDNRLKEPLLVRWIELDPHGAVEGTQDRREWWDHSPAWSYWAKADPKAALAAAKNRSPAIENWLRGVVEKQSIATTREADPHAAVLKGRAAYQDDFAALRKWIVKDPAAALIWVQQNNSGRHHQKFVWVADHTATHHPDRLAQLAAILPTGRLKRGLLTRHAHLLAKEDLSAVLAMAKEEKSPLLRKEYCAAAGIALAPSDPARSLALLEEFLSGLPAPLSKQVMTNQGLRSVADYDAYSYGWSAWISALLEKQPEPTMDLLYEAASVNISPCLGAARGWMARARPNFERWLKGQAPGRTRDDLTILLVDLYARGFDANYPAAISWIMTLSNSELQKQKLQRVVSKWERLDREDAAAFFNSDAAPPRALELLGWKLKSSLVPEKP